MSLLGKEGLRRLADLNFQKAHYLQSELKKRGFTPLFDKPFFNEFAVKCPVPPSTIQERLSRERVLPGLPLGEYYPAHKDAMLMCVTEIKTRGDMDSFIGMLENVCR
jgi:glycine dehydrogenase subunit 1